MAQPTSYDPNIIEIKSKVSAVDACPLNRASCVRCAHIPALDTAFSACPAPYWRLFVTLVLLTLDWLAEVRQCHLLYMFSAQLQHGSEWACVCVCVLSVCS